MLDKTIEKMKQQLDQMILTEKLGSKRLLQQSQALDRLIVVAMRRKAYKLNGNSTGDNRATVYPQYVEDGNNEDNAAARHLQDYNFIDDLMLTPIRTG